MPQSNTCWKCGGPLPDLLLPLPRHEECPHCRAQLHVCRMCEFFDPVAPQQCREPVADLVSDKVRSNFCGYFQISPNAFTASPGQVATSRQGLDALFGDETAEPEADVAEETLHDPLEQLFKK